MSHSRNRVWIYLVVVTLSLSVAACQPAAETPAPAAPAPAPDPAAELAPVVDAFVGVWNSKDYAKLDSILAADFQRIAPDQNAEGLEAMKAFMMQAHAAYADFNIVIEERGYGENAAFFQWTVSGTYGEGEAGMPIEIPGITLLRVDNGAITHEIVQYDTAALAAQAGAETAPHVE